MVCSRLWRDLVTSPVVDDSTRGYLRLFLDTKVLVATGGHPHVATTDSTASTFSPHHATIHFLLVDDFLALSFSSSKFTTRLIVPSHSLHCLASFAHNVQRNDTRNPFDILAHAAHKLWNYQEGTQFTVNEHCIYQYDKYLMCETIIVFFYCFSIVTYYVSTDVNYFLGAQKYVIRMLWSLHAPSGTVTKQLH